MFQTLAERPNGLSDRLYNTLSRLGRFGYAARAVVFWLVAAITLQAAVFRDGPVRNAGGSLGILVREPFGNLIIGLIAVGLSAYVVWRLVQAVTLPVVQPSGAGRYFRRLAYAASGLFLRFMRLYDRERAPSTLAPVLKPVGAVGLSAMGGILTAAGGFVIQAALQDDAYRIRDLGGILRSLGTSSYGPILLTVAAVGIAVYGAHCFLLGAFRITEREA